MTEQAKEKWQGLSQHERRAFLKQLFIKVLVNDPHLPDFLTEEDMADFKRDTDIGFYSYRPTQNQYSATVDLEEFAYRYWVPGSDKFFILLDYLQHQLATTKVDELNLFSSFHEENNRVWFELNLDAVHLCLSRE